MFTTGVPGGSFGTLLRWAKRNETECIAKKSSLEAFSRKVIRWATSVSTQGPMSKAQPRTTVVHDTVFVSFMKIRDVYSSMNSILNKYVMLTVVKQPSSVCAFHKERQRPPDVSWMGTVCDTTSS